MEVESALALAKASVVQDPFFYNDDNCWNILVDAVAVGVENVYEQLFNETDIATRLKLVDNLRRLNLPIGGPPNELRMRLESELGQVSTQRYFTGRETKATQLPSDQRPNERHHKSKGLFSTLAAWLLKPSEKAAALESARAHQSNDANPAQSKQANKANHQNRSRLEEVAENYRVYG